MADAVLARVGADGVVAAVEDRIVEAAEAPDSVTITTLNRYVLPLISPEKAYWRSEMSASVVGVNAPPAPSSMHTCGLW